MNKIVAVLIIVCFLALYAICDRTHQNFLFQVLEPIDRAYMVIPQSEQSLQQISSQFRDALRLDTLEQNSENKVCHYLLLVFLL